MDGLALTIRTPSAKFCVFTELPCKWEKLPPALWQPDPIRLGERQGLVISPNHPTNESRDPMGKKSKRYRAALEKQPQAALSLEQAVETLKKYDSTKFDQTVEIHMRLGVDPNQADQIIRGLEDTELRERLIRSGRERTGRFSWDKTARESLALYEELS